MTGAAETRVTAAPPRLGPRGVARPRVESRTIAVVAVVAVLVYLVLGPFVLLLLSSFKETENSIPFGPDVPWAISNYVTIATNPGTYSVLWNTLFFAAGSLGLSFTLSVAFAWLIERSDLPLRNVLFVVIVASIGIPGVISGIAWILLFNPSNGVANLWLRGLFGLDGRGPLDIYTIPGITVIQGITMVPITFLLVVAAFRGMDAALEDAGSASGAKFRTILRRVTLPLLTPALLSALVYQFVTALESFDIPLIIGVRGGLRVLSTEIYLESRPPDGLPDYGMAAAYSMLLMIVVLVPLLIYNRVIARSERFATISGRGFQPRRIRLGVLKIPALILAWAYILLSLVLPVLILIWTSLQPFFAPPTVEALSRVSVKAYEYVLGDPRLHSAILNTAILGFGTAFGAMTVALLVSWVIVRTRSRFRPLLDLLAFMPHVMPGVLLALSVLLIYLILPLPIYGTIWIVVIALTTQYISVTTRLMSASITQVNAELEEAAAASGATWWHTMRRVVLPLVAPAFLNGMLLVLLLAIKNLTFPAILGSQKTAVVSTYIWRLWEYDINIPGTAAASTLMVIVTVILGLALRAGSRGETQLT
jgi:iron(III) transport system permease protein